MFVYGDVVYGDVVIDPEKLYRATSYASTTSVVASYGPRFYSTVL